MMKSMLKILLLGTVLGFAAPALAGTLDDRDPRVRSGESGIVGSESEHSLTVTQSNGPTLAEAVEMVKRQYKGRIVSAETKKRGNRDVHHIKVLTEDGKVKTVQIQGRSRQP